MFIEIESFGNPWFGGHSSLPISKTSINIDSIVFLHKNKNDLEVFVGTDVSYMKVRKNSISFDDLKNLLSHKNFKEYKCVSYWVDGIVYLSMDAVNHFYKNESNLLVYVGNMYKLSLEVSYEEFSSNFEYFNR